MAFASGGSNITPPTGPLSAWSTVYDGSFSQAFVFHPMSRV